MWCRQVNTLARQPVGPLFDHGVRYSHSLSNSSFALTTQCTGAEFCGLALVETKVNAEEMGKKLEKLVSVDRTIRIHWTGCPNSCGQVQVADIGIMGAPARKEIDGKNMAVPGCKIFVGGKIGEESHLALEPYKVGVPLEEEDLIPVLVDILKTEFGAVDKAPEKKGVRRIMSSIISRFSSA